MRTCSSAMIACAALLLVSGCGSSGGTGSGTTTSAATGTGTSAGKTATTTTGTSKSPSAKIKFSTTPKFAVPAASAPVQSGTVAISYHNIAIAPDALKVKVGSTIKWTNYDPVQHNVTSEGGPQKFASKNFGEGGTFEIKANKPGVIHYECTLHPTTMNGTIEVLK